MVLVLVLLFLLLWQYRKRNVYNPYEEKYSHSDYYDAAFCERARCTDRICKIWQEIAGCHRLLQHYRLAPGVEAEVLLIHESGIYVASSYELEGSLYGNPSGRYWIQSLREGWMAGYRNYIYNPFLANKRSLDVIRWELRDMPGIPCYSMAVSGNRGQLLTSGYMGENRWALPLSALPVVTADIMRHNRKFLKPEQVEMIYRKLIQKEGKDQ